MTLPAATLILALASGQVLPPWMTGESRAEDLAISVATFGPGTDLYEWWGHTALIVEDKRLNQGRLYNFGMFGGADVAEFVKNTAKGLLWFWVADASVGGTMVFYRQLNRDVRLQDLDLTPAQAFDVAKALGTHVLPENRMYLYRHYDDNCSTRPRDIIDRALGGQLLAASMVPGRMSIRRHVTRYAQHVPPMALLLDFLENDTLDGPTTVKREAFLPDELEQQLQAFQVTQPDGSKRPLVKKQLTWFKSDRKPVPETAANFIPHCLAIGLCVGGLAVWLGRRMRSGRRGPRIGLGLLVMGWGLFPGVLGAGLFMMAFFTDHDEMHRNENLFFLNPLTFFLVLYGLALARNRPVALSRLRWGYTALAAGAIFDAVGKVLPFLDQDNWNILALVLPVNVAFAVTFTLLAKAAAAQPGPSAPSTVS